jgi:hypothetical protein
VILENAMAKIPPETVKKSFFRYPEKISKLGKILGGVAVYCVGVYFASSYFRASGSIPTEKRNQAGGSTYDDLAPYYDAKLSLDEWVTGITKLRRKRMLIHLLIVVNLLVISEHSKGEVLEIACGTGRNIGVIVGFRHVLSSK